MTAMLILNGVFMVMIVAAILSVLVWGIVTDRPWREFVRQANLRRAQRATASVRPRQPVRPRRGYAGQSGLAAR